jgi:hypothetical protein
MRCVASFNEAFWLRNVEGVRPPGDCSVYVEDELIQGHSFERHLSARVHNTPTAVDIVGTGAPRLVSVDASDLKEALKT